MALAFLPALAVASARGGHKADVGILFYGQDSDRGGALVEGRWNLAPEEQDAALFVTGALGMGSWYSSTRPSPMMSLLPDWDKKKDNYTTWRSYASPFMDLGLGITYGEYTGGIGFCLATYDIKATKKINGEIYTGGEASGTKPGLYIQGGWELPIGRYFLDLLVGYRETRGDVDLTMKSGSKVTTASVKPLAGAYARAGMRYRF
jgi:hypothetical protein